VEVKNNYQMKCVGNVDKNGEKRKMTNDFSDILIETWKRLISQYEQGLILITNEKSLEIFFIKNCENIIQEKKLNIPIGRQKEFYGKRVDIWIGNDNPTVVELKIFHDPADWKETRGMTNTVETDLNFAKGDSRVWVAVLDVIPSIKRPDIPFKIDWTECNIIKKVFEQNYQNISPPSSPSREQRQRWFFVNGENINS